MTGMPSLFELYGRDLLAKETPCSHALKDHSQIPVMIDILSRKENHHLNLIGVRSEKIQFAFLEALANYLAIHTPPHALRNVMFFYLDTHQLTLSGETLEKITQDFFTLCETLQLSNKKIILAVNKTNVSEHFTHLINALTTNECWRIITFNATTSSLFAQLKLIEPSKSQLLSLLKSYKEELERYHRVLIPEDTFASAFSMASHFLTNQFYFDKALELIDSASARASAMDHTDPSGQLKPIVSNATLSQVVSHWTQIPLANLYNNSFQASKFVEALQRRVFGQEAAIGYMGSVLQHAYIKLQEKSGPLCAFLLVGPPETGKSTTAQSLAEHLFGHRNALLSINLNENYSSISQVKITTEENHHLTLLEAIQETPYGIIFLKNIDQASASTLALFKNIFSHGFVMDDTGIKYDFKHTIFILSTTIVSDRISTLMQAPALVETNKSLDLMQLVLNEQCQEQTDHLNLQLSLQDICEELLPDLEGCFGSELLQQLNIVPFMPLDYLSLEKIMRSNLKNLARRLELNFAIELTHTPEVIKFLAHEAFWRKPSSRPIEKILEQHLYGAVANEILSHANDKHQPRRLVIQLNDDGQLLRCEPSSSLASVF